MHSQWFTPLAASGIHCCCLVSACVNCCPLVCCLSLSACGSRMPQSWGYFAINSAALVAQPGPFMLLRCGSILVVCCNKTDALALQVASHLQGVSNVSSRGWVVFTLSPVSEQSPEVMEVRSCSRARQVPLVARVGAFAFCYRTSGGGWSHC